MAYNKRQKLSDNIAALRVAFAAAGGQQVSEEDRDLLKRFSGFGGLKFILNPCDKEEDKSRWTQSDQPYFDATRELFQLIRDNSKDEAEYLKYVRSVRSSILSAFYTPMPVINAISGALKNAGVEVHTMLDPSSGKGSFVESFLSDRPGMEVTAFEKDLLTGKVLQALYPDADVHVDGYETIDKRFTGHFDVAASNIPFGDISVFDPSFTMSDDDVRRHAAKAIHNYFFLKTLDNVREGGIVAFITSQGVMDSPRNKEIRQALMERAYLVGAVRLPNNMFSDEAGTDVGSDLIILQKDSMKQRSYTAFSPEERAFVDNINDLSDSLDDLGLEPEQVEGYRQANPNAYIFCSEYLWDSDSAYLGEHSFGKDQYGKFAIVSHFDGSMEELGKQLQDRLDGFMKYEFNKELYQEHALKVQEPVKAVESHRGSEQAVNDGVKNTSVQQPVKQGAKQKVSQQASAPVQLDFFAIWDEQEEQRLSMEPRSYSGEILSHYRDGVIIIDNDQVGVLSNVGMSTIFKPLTLTEDVLSRLRYYIPVRDAYQQLYAIEAEQHVEQKELREKLNRVYDSFIMRYGSLNDKKNFKAITSDILGKDMLCIENNVDGKFIKSDIFDRPVSFNANELDHVENALDALSASLNRSGGVDLDYMCEISGKSNDELLSELRERIFFNPDNGEYEVRDKFLAGNVIEKIDFFENNYGKEHLETMDDEITRSYHALLEVRPRQIPFAELDFNFGERWMPKEYFEEFASELFDVKVDIQYAANLDEFVVTSEGSSEKIRSEFAVHNENGDVTDGLQMLRFALYNTVPTIQKVVGYKPNGDPIKGPDHERMQLAASKIDAIRDAFSEWINGHEQSWKDDLADMYNRKFNCFVRPEYDGTHQTFPDLDFKSLKAKKKIESAYDSQKNAVWMILQNGGGICDHEVGTGKTLIMCMAAHEMKRLGMAHKPIIIGMKANVSEIAATYQAAYPNARVLYASEKDYDTAHRVEFFNRAKNNDYDVIIMSHDQFGMIPQSAEIQRDVLEEELYALDEALDVYEQQGYKVSGRMKSGLQKKKENLEAKLQEINYTLSRRQDDVVDFKTMGIDHIFVDESQAFKNLPFTTRDSRVAGLGDPEGSKRARNLMYAIRTIQQQTGRDLGATFLSGTTISNSLTELYLLFKYLRPQALAAQDIHSFDAWAAVFATKTRDYEINVAGQVVMKERFRKFIKVPELGAFYNEITDYKTAADVGLERPEMNAKLVNISPTADHNDISKRLLDFANSGNPEYIFRDNLSDNEMQAKMLIVTNLGKKASLSPKLVNEDLYSESDDTKLGVAAKNISEYYEKYKEHRGTQFVFCDLSTPKKGQWTAYQELKDRLVQQYGIPEDEIFFMQDAGSEKKREKIIEKMNRGEIRVLFGSTTTLGTGVNAQERCVAIHHLDLPWRPSDMEQRNGRGVRKGNEVARLYADNKVDVLIYAVERSLDSYNFYLLQAKSDFIRQMKTGALGKRDFDMGSEDEENGMNFQEYVAITSGNTDLLDRAKMEKKVLALEAERKAFNKERSSQEVKLSCTRSDLEKYERYIEHFHKDFETIVGIDKATFSEDPEEVEHAVTSLQSDGYGMDYMYVSQYEFTNKRSVDALATTYGVQKMVNGAEFVVLRGEALGDYLQSLARVELDGEVMIGSIDRNPVKAWITMESVHQFNSKTGVNSYVGNKFYVKGEELKYTWNEGKVNLRDKKEASLYITRAIGRIPGLIDYYQENIISKQKQVQDLEEILKKSWPKADDLSALKKQLQDLDRKIQQEMENDNILNNHGQVAEELPYKIEQKSYGREPWELTFKVKDYPFIGRADRERIEEELHGSIRVYDGKFKGSFRHQYGAEQAIKELSHLNAIHRDDKEFLMSMAKDIYEEACLPSVIRLKELGFDRHGNPLTGDNARTMKVMALGDYQNVRALAHGVKDNAESVIYIAAEALAKAINDMDDKDKYVLVAMPTSGDRYRTYTDRLCSRLSTLTGLEYANCLEGVEHDSLYDWKKEHPGEKLPELFFSVRGHNRIPEGKTALIIDNVIDTGHTAMAALDAMEHDPVMLVLGSTGNHVNYYKNVEVTMVENGMKYVEESLPEGVGLTGKSQQEIDKLLTDARSGEWGSYFEASKNLDRIGIDWYTGQPKYVVHDFVKRWDDADNTTLSEPLKALLEKGSVEALFTDEELGKLTAREKQLMKVCLDFFIGKKDNDYRFDRRQQRQLLIVYDYLKDKVTPKVEIQEVQGEDDVHALKKDNVEETASEEIEIITPKDSEERGNILSAETVKSGDNTHVGFSAVISDGEEQGVEHLVKSVFYDGKMIGSILADMETGKGNPFRMLRDDAVKETCLLNVLVHSYDSHDDAWEGVADRELDGYYDYGCIRFENEEDMIRFYEANRQEVDYRNERYDKIESAYATDGRTSAEVLSIQLPVSYAESLMSIDKQRDLDTDEAFIVNHSQEERERLRYVEGEFFEDYLKRNLLDRRDSESLLYFHDKYSEEQWLEIDHIFRAGMTKDNAHETGEKISALSYVSSKQEGYSLMGLLRYVQPDAILPFLDGVSAAFNKLGLERSELKKQYDTLKEKHPDALLLFRGGDFYETYEKDAKTASDILGITITWSDNDKSHNLETYEGAMAAFPHHALDTYLPKLVRAGQRVAICDLLEDPKNLVSNVKRDITMLVDRHADVRLQVVGNEEDMKHVLPHDAMLRDALIERLRAAGIPVVTDAAVAEDVLMNGNLVREHKAEDRQIFDERLSKIQEEYSSLIEVLPVRFENAEKAFNDYRMELIQKYGEDFNSKITEEEDVRLSTLQGEMWKLEPEIDGYDSIAFRMLAESHGWNFMIGFDYYGGELRIMDQLAAEYALGVRQPMDDMKRQAVEQTDGFKQWFGDWQKDAERASKVIGSDGRPMVLYHGTGVENAFSIFDRAKAGRSNDMAAIGFWFTPSSDFAQRWTEEVWYAGRMGGYAIPVYLDIKNPKVYRPLGEEQKAESERLLEQLRGVRAEMKEIHDKYNYVNYGYKDIEAFHIGCRNGFVYNPSDNYSNYYSPEAAERQREYYATRTENGRQAIEDGERYYQLSEQERMLEDNYNSLAFGDSYEQFKIDFYVHAGMRPGDACIGGLGMALRDPQKARETFRDYLKSQGYDGIIIEDTKYDRRMAGTEANTQYIVFEPEQIKSAIENNGEFLRENPDIRYFRNGDHEVYGFVNNGTIYVDPRIATAETPIHEYTHLWAEVLRVNNRDEWKNIVQMMKDTPEVWNEVRRLYPWIKDENQITEEALARYSGHRGYERLMALVDDEPGNRNILDKMLEALDKFWHAVADFLHIHYTSKEQVADQVLHDLLSGVNPLDYRQVNSRSFKEWFGDWKTASFVKQLDIVHMQDDYVNYKGFLPKISREAREVYDKFAFDMGSKYGFDWLENLSVEEREEEHRLYDYRDKYDLDENDPDELAFEMLSERYPSELLALVGHSNGRLYPLYDEEEILEVSKMVHEDGTPMVVYHGSSWDPLSEAAGDAVFDDSYRGVASQDNGFFGRGFYFTFGNGDLSKQEAAYYGSKVGEYFLNIRRPFMFHETLGTLNGFDPIGDEKNTVGVINMVRHFPELVKDYRLSTYDGFGEYSGEISLEEYVRLFEDVYKNKEFIVTSDPDKMDDNIIGVFADPVQHHEVLPSGMTHDWTEYGFQMRMYRPSVHDDAQLAFAHYYMTDMRDFMRDAHRECVVDIPSNLFSELYESEEFTAELKRRGYDGIMQSVHGDEVVVFEPNQIKSATDNIGLFSSENNDIRYHAGIADDVREENFKRWFGDWQVDALITEKDVRVEPMADYDNADLGGAGLQFRVISDGKVIGFIPLEGYFDFKTNSPDFLGKKEVSVVNYGFGAEIKPEYRHKGFGKAAYLAVAKELAASGNVLCSADTKNMSDDAKGLWSSLENAGLVYFSENRYLFNNDRLFASKVVDADGKPLVVEHGTNAEFTFFDANKIGYNSKDNGLFGAGFYFGTKAPAWLDDNKGSIQRAIKLHEVPELRDLFAKAEPTKEDVTVLSRWLKAHKDDSIVLYHGTDSSLPILQEGLKRTSMRTKRSLQSGTGNVYLTPYPGFAKAFGGYAYPEHEDSIAVYDVAVKVKDLHADKDQLKNKRMAGIDFGDSLAASMLVGHSATVKHNIENYDLQPHNTYHVMRVYLDIKRPFEITDSVKDIYTEIKEKLDTSAMRGLTLTGLNGKQMKVGEYIDVIKAVDDLIEHNPVAVNGQIVHDEELQAYHPKDRLQMWREHEISRISGMGALPMSWQVVISEQIGSHQFTAAAIQDGYDGVIVTRSEDYKEYVAFEPSQIKSATDNIGLYSKQDNDIRYHIVEEKTERRVLTAEEREVGGAVVDQLGKMGISVHTDNRENRRVLKEAQKDQSEVGKVRYMKTSDGESYGFAYKGEVYLDLRKIDGELPLHEYAHLWCQAMRRVNPAGWENITDIIKADNDTMTFVRSKYPELTDDNDLIEEVIAHYSGKRGAEKLHAELQRMMDKDDVYSSRWGNIYQNISKSIQDFWKHIGDSLNIRYVSKEDIADQILNDFARQVNPVEKMERWLVERDNEYAAAVESGDTIKARDMFWEALQENIGNGITPFMAVDGYRGKLDRLARAVKEGKSEDLNKAAMFMSDLVPDNAVLVPAPSHEGLSTYTRWIANRIKMFKNDSVEVADVLRCYEHESQYEHKKSTGKALSSDELRIYQHGELPEGKIPVIIDNVINTGNTAEACVKALGRGIVLSLASAVSQERHVASLKSLASVVYDKEGNLIPLSERFELKGRYLGRPMLYKPLEKGEIYGLESYDEKEILKYVREHFEVLREQYDFDAEIVDMRVIGSRVVGNHDEDSDLDVLLEYKGKAREDGLFNILNDDEDQLFIEGIPVDINPITEAKSGTIAEFLARNADYDKAIDKSYKYNNDNNMAKTVLTIEVNGHGSDIYHTMRDVSGGVNAVLADNICFVGFDDECRVAVSLHGDVTRKEEGLREITFPDERTMALFVQKILGWNHMRSINDTTMLAGSFAYEHLSHVMEGAYELTRVHGQQNAFAEQLLQLWSGDRSSLGDQSIKQFFLEKFRYLNDGEHKAFRDEWNALSAMCNNHLRELAWMSAYVMDDSMIDSLFRVVPSLDKEEQKEGIVINKPMQYAVSYGSWEGVNGLWHVDFGRNINAVSFKEKQSMAAAMGGEARTTYEHEWADFDDKDKAVLFAERVVTANQERLSAHQEQFNKTINGMAPIFAVPANEHVGFRYGTHGVKRDSGNADFDRQMSVFLNQYHRDHKEKGNYIYHYTFGFLFFEQKEALAFAEAYRQFAEDNGFKDVYEKLCFITKKQKFFDQVLGGPKPAEFQLVQKRLAEGTYLCETGRDFASEVHYPDDAQKVWLKYAMKQQELFDMVQAAGKEGEIRRLPVAIGEALWYKVENNTIELYETLSDASEGMSPIFPIWKEYKDFENTVDIISRDVRPAAKMHLMDSQAAVMTKQSILNDIYYFTDGNLMQEYTARYISHADDISELLNREIGGHTISYYYAESLKHVAEKNGYENFEQLLENFDDLPEVSEEEKEIEDVILEDNKELVEKRKVSVPLTDEEYREVSVMGSIIYHMQAAGISVYLDRDLTFAKTTSDDRVRQMLNEGGKAYGIVRDDGVIFVDPNVATAETPIHEYTHLWAEVLRQQNPEEWKNIVMMMRDIPLWNEVKEKYPNLYRSDDIAEEVLAHYSGKRGHERLLQSFGLKEGDSVSSLPEEKRNLFDKISEVIARFWSSVADFLHIHYTSKEQVADQILKDIVNHVNPLDFRKVMPDKIINGMARAHFIGEQGAKNIAKSRMSFLPDMLVQAKRYDAEGMDAVRIKMITGWEKGVDDKWRYEVSNTRVKSMVIDGDTVLSNVIYAPDLFAAYPEMANIKVRVGGTSERAVYNHETHTITLNNYYRQHETPREEFESVMKKNEGEIKDVEEKIAAGENEAFNKSKLQELENTRAFINGQIASARSIDQIWPDINAVFDHETQHIIQDIEGFARGGSLRTVADMRLAEAQKLVEKFEPYYEQYKELEYLVTHEEDTSVALSYMYEKESFEKEHGPEITAYLAAKLQRDNAELDIVSGMLSERNIREYNNLAGEVEARNVMARRDMSIMERRKSLASSTEDVSREEQIVTHKGISAAMVDEKVFDQILDDNKDVLERMKNNPIDHSQDKGYHITIGTDDRPGGVEGEYHLQFTKEIPYVKFEEMMKMAHDMGGSARIMNGNEWVDFYSEDDAVKFGDKVIALNADRIVAERELASKERREQLRILLGDVIGTHGQSIEIRPTDIDSHTKVLFLMNNNGTILYDGQKDGRPVTNLILDIDSLSVAGAQFLMNSINSVNSSAVKEPVREKELFSVDDILSHDDKFRYMLLSRMESDVKYYLGNGNRYAPDLWAKEESRHIDLMYRLWDSFKEKPEWLTREQIDVYAKQMGVGREMDGQKENLVNDVHQLIKEAGLEYSALTPRIPVTVTMVNDEGIEEKKIFSHAMVSKNDIEVFEDRYDTYDGRNGYKLSELPEASQVEVLRVIKEQYGDLDRQVTVHIDKQEVPEYALSAIVNGDFSGIDSEEDSKNIREFMDRKFYKGAEFIPREESASFTSRPAFGLATDCVTVDIVRFATIRELREEQKQISKDLPFPEVIEDARVRLDHALQVAPLEVGKEMHIPGNTHFAVKDYDWFDLKEHIKNGGGIPHAYALVNDQEKGIGFLMGRDAMFVPVDKLRQEDLSKLVYGYESAVLYELVKANGAIQFDEPVTFVHTTALEEHIQGSIKEVSIDGDVLRFEGTRQWSDGHTESLKGFGISNGGMEALFNKVMAMNIQKVDAPELRETKEHLGNVTREELLKRVVEKISLDNQAYSPEEQAIVRDAVTVMLEKYNIDYYQSKVMIPEMVKTYDISDRQELETVVASVVYDIQDDALRRDADILKSYLPVDMSREDEIGRMVTEAVNYAERIVDYRVNKLHDVVSEKVEDINKTVAEYNRLSSTKDPSFSLTKHIQYYELTVQGENELALVDGVERNFVTSWMGARELLAHIDTLEQKMKEQFPELIVSKEEKVQDATVSEPKQEESKPAEKKSSKWENFDYSRCRLPEGIKLDRKEVFIDRTGPKAKYFLIAEGYGKSFKQSMYPNDIKAYYLKDDYGRKTPKCTIDQLVAKYFGKQFAEAMSIGSVSEAEHVLSEQKEEKVNVIKDKEQKVQAHAESEKSREAEEAANKKAEEAKRREKKEKVPAIILQASLLSGALAASEQHDGFFLNLSGKQSPVLYHDDQAVSAFNALMMGLHADANGYKTYVYTTYDSSKADGCHVKGGESGLPFNWYQWDKYISKFNAHDVITKEAYDQLDPQMKELYSILRTKEERSVFNIDQTNMSEAKADDYKSLISSILPVCSVSVSGSVDMKQLIVQSEMKKQEYPDKILLMRHDSQYEVFGSDAADMAKIIDVPVEEVDYDGKAVQKVSVPVDTLEAVLPKVVDAGYHVLFFDDVAEQLSVKGTVSSDEIYRKCDQLVAALEKTDQNVQVNPTFDTQYDVKEGVLRVNNERSVVSGEEMKIALDRINDTYRACVGYTGAEQRLNRSASVMTLPADRQRYELLVQDLAAGVMMMREGLPAKLSADVINDIPFWQRELKESPKMLESIESDVNHAVQVLENIRDDVEVDYSSLRENKSFEALGEQSYSIASEIANSTDIETKKVVLVKDTKHNSAAVILPSGASLEVNNELAGMNKNGYVIALRKEGFDDVRFFNAGGVLGLNQPNEFFADKEVVTAQLKDYTIHEIDGLDFSQELARNGKVDIEQVTITLDDNNNPVLFVKPSDREAFTVYADRNDLNLFVESMKTQNFDAVRESLGQKYYDLVKKYPNLKRDILVPDTEGIDLSRITSVNITKDRAKDNTTIILVAIDGEQQAPVQLSKGQAQHLWLADDIDKYKVSLAAQLFKDKLGIDQGHSEDGQVQFRDDHEGQHVSTDEVPSEEAKEVHEETVEGKRGLGL